MMNYEWRMMNVKLKVKNYEWRVKNLKEDIKQEDLDIYLDLFRRNTALNKELINLAKEGIITK